MDFGVMLYLV